MRWHQIVSIKQAVAELDIKKEYVIQLGVIGLMSTFNQIKIKTITR